MKNQTTTRELWELLEAATSDPEVADLNMLWISLAETLQLINQSSSKLKVAADAIAQMADIVYERSLSQLESLEYMTPLQEPELDSLEEFLMAEPVDFSTFIKPIAAPVQPPSEPEETPQSIVGPVDTEQLLQALDQYEQHQKALSVAHEEDVSAWQAQVQRYFDFSQAKELPLLELVQGLEMGLVKIWMTLLLGGYQIEQRGDNFYDPSTVWILLPETASV